MSDQIKQIATRIRELREISGATLENTANELNISVDTYQKYESGYVDIPVSFLYAIASKFNVELTAILTGDAPKLHTYSLVRKDKGINVERRKEYKYQSLAYNFVHKKAEPFLVTVAPVGEDAVLHFNSHPGQEFNYVLEGIMKVIINDNEIVLNQGDSLFFDSNAKHGMKAMGGAQTKFLAIIF